MRKVAAALALGGLAACGWHTGLVAPDGADSVGVAYFQVDKDVYERDVEPLLHDKITRSVSDLVDASLVAPGDADLVIRGRIYDYRRRGGIRGRDNQLLETSVRLGVEARLERRATGEVLATVNAQIPSGYVAAERQVVDLSLGPDTETILVGGRPNEAAARDRALRFLADQIVLDLFRVQEAEVPER